VERASTSSIELGRLCPGGFYLATKGDGTLLLRAPGFRVVGGEYEGVGGGLTYAFGRRVLDGSLVFSRRLLEYGRGGEIARELGVGVPSVLGYSPGSLRAEAGARLYPGYRCCCRGRALAT